MTPRNPLAAELPREVYIEVTNRCNSRCETCIRTFEQLEPWRDLSLTEFKIIIAQFPALDRVILHGIGEPLLNAELADMICYVKSIHPTAKVLFNSNAILLHDEWQHALIDAGLDEFRISLDAATTATYAHIRGVDAFDEVIANLRRFTDLLDAAPRPRLSFWFTAMRENLPELPDLVNLAVSIGVPEIYVQRLVLIDHGVARAEQSLYHSLRAQEENALAEAAQRAAAHGILFRASGLTSPQESLRGGADSDKPWSRCYRLWTSTYITANGNVLPCCISPFSTTNYAGIVLGNVFETPFPEIWNGERYVARRTALYTEMPLPPPRVVWGAVEFVKGESVC